MASASRNQACVMTMVLPYGTVIFARAGAVSASAQTASASLNEMPAPAGPDGPKNRAIAVKLPIGEVTCSTIGGAHSSRTTAADAASQRHRCDAGCARDCQSPPATAHAETTATHGNSPAWVWATKEPIASAIGSSASRPAIAIAPVTIRAAKGTSSTCGFQTLVSSRAIWNRYAAIASSTASAIGLPTKRTSAQTAMVSVTRLIANAPASSDRV
jgi:hypothetical protein